MTEQVLTTTDPVEFIDKLQTAADSDDLAIQDDDGFLFTVHSLSLNGQTDGTLTYSDGQTVYKTPLDTALQHFTIVRTT